MSSALSAAGQGQSLSSHLSAEGETVWPRAYLTSRALDTKLLGQLWVLDTPTTREAFVRSVNMGRDSILPRG